MSGRQPTLRLSPRVLSDSLFARAWQSLTWHHHALTLFACLAFGVSGGLYLWASVPPGALLWKVVAAHTYQTLLIGYLLLFAIAIANQVAVLARWTWLPYTLAALLIPLAGAAIARFTWSVRGPLGFREMPFWLDFVSELPNWIVLAACATFAIAFHRRSQQRLAALRSAQLEQAHLNRQALESRLQAMQARVEPQFLFNTLAHVERLYESDPTLALRMLDDLIVYLRAALPQLRETTSTLDREIALTRAYLDIIKVRVGERLAFEIARADDADDVQFPPMVLLPLIDHVIAHSLDSGDASVRIEASVADGKLRLAVVASGTGFGDDSPGIEAIRGRLNALYGADARLALERIDGHGARAVIEIPWKRVS